MVLYSAGAPGPATVKGSVFDTPVGASADIFSSDLEPSYSPTTFRIYACFFDAGGLGGKLIIRRTVGVVTRSEELNAGGLLNSDAAYTFDIIVEIGESINIWYGIAATCRSLKVLEVAGAVS